MHSTLISWVLAYLLMVCQCAYASPYPVKDLGFADQVSKAELVNFSSSSEVVQTSTPRIPGPVASPATTAPPSPDETPVLEKRGFFRTILGPETNQSFGGPCGGLRGTWPGKKCEWTYPGEAGWQFFDPDTPQPPTLTSKDSDLTDVTQDHHDPLDPCKEARVYTTTGFDLVGNFAPLRVDADERYLCCKLCHESELDCVAAFMDEQDSKCTLFINHSNALPSNFRHDETHVLRKTEKCPHGIFDVGKAYRRNETCPPGNSVADHGTATDQVKDCEGYMPGPCWIPIRNDFPYPHGDVRAGYMPLSSNLNNKWIDEDNPYGWHYDTAGELPFEGYRYEDKYQNKDDYHVG